jgi:cytochrome P450
MTFACTGPGAQVLDLFGRLQQTKGDIVSFPVAEGRLSILVNDADALRHVLVQNSQRFERETHWQFAVPLLTDQGRQFLGIDGARAAQRQRWESIAQSMVDQLSAALDHTAPVEIATVCYRAGLDVMARTLFGADMGADINRFLDATSALDAVRMQDRAAFYVPENRPSSKTEGEAAISCLLDIADRVSKGRNAGPSADPVLVRRGIVEFLVLAFESFTNAICFGLLTFAAHPELAASFREASGSDPFEEGTENPYDFRGMFVRELLRFYPPVWMSGRSTLVDDQIAGVQIPAGSIVTICPYTLHRNPKYWLNPAVFDPSRFALPPERPLAFCPFGAGPRMCIASGFSLRELSSIFSAILARYDLQGQEISLIPHVMTTLHPAPGAVVGAVLRS